MNPGDKVTIRWIDDDRLLQVSFVEVDRGFFVFLDSITGEKYVARPHSIEVVSREER